MPKRTPWDHRVPAHLRGFGSAWRKARDATLMRDKHMCVTCRKRGYITTDRLEVDHIVPRANGGTDALSNLQTLCHDCHVEKTIRENGGTPKRRIGLDGWPVE